MIINAPIMATAGASIGAMLGTSFNNNLLSNINQTIGSQSFFGSDRDPFADVGRIFYERSIKPIQQMSQLISSTVNALINPDLIRPLLKLEDLYRTPAAMQLPILLFPPVQELFQQGRVFGYGYDPENFVGQEDVYGRLINNGVVEDVLANIDENGDVVLSYTWKDDDPDLSDDELDAIADTRSFLQTLIDDTSWDPTDPQQDRG